MNYLVKRGKPYFCSSLYPIRCINYKVNLHFLDSIFFTARLFPSCSIQSNCYNYEVFNPLDRYSQCTKFIFICLSLAFRILIIRKCLHVNYLNYSFNSLDLQTLFWKALKVSNKDSHSTQCYSFNKKIILLSIVFFLVFASTGAKWNFPLFDQILAYSCSFYL